jgi:hypothetical protein
MYQLAELNKKLLPSVEYAFKKLAEADKADDKRDVRPLMSILYRIVQASPRTRGHLMTRSTGVSSFTWELTSEDDSLQEELILVKSRLRDAIRSILRYSVDTAAYGAMLLQLAWELSPQTKAQTPRLVKRYLPFEFERYDESSVAIFDDTAKLNRKKVAPEDYNFIYAFDDSTERGGVLRTIMIHEILRHETVLEWANFNQRLKGVVAGMINIDEIRKAGLNDEQTAEQIEALDATLAGAGKNNYLKAIHGIDIQFKTLVEAAGNVSFKEYLQMLENSIAIAILGQANTAELPSGGGSRAALQILNMIRADIVYNDMQRCTELINNLLLTDYRLNKDNTATTVPYEFTFIHDEAIDIETYSVVIGNCIDHGIPLDASEVYTKLSLQQPKPGEELKVTPAL